MPPLTGCGHACSGHRTTPTSELMMTIAGEIWREAVVLGKYSTGWSWWLRWLSLSNLNQHSLCQSLFGQQEYWLPALVANLVRVVKLLIPSQPNNLALSLECPSLRGHSPLSKNLPLMSGWNCPNN